MQETEGRAVTKDTEQLGLFGGVEPVETKKRSSKHPEWSAEIRSVVLMEDPVRGTFVKADNAKKQCECPEFENGSCGHLDLLPRVLEKHSTARYTFKSALHKSVRRSDVHEALVWARWLAHAEGTSTPKSYAQNILLEETRNARLLLE